MDLFSEEWFNTLIGKLKEDQQFQKKGRNFDSNMQFSVLKDRKVKLNSDVTFGMWFPTCEPKWFGSKPKEEVDIILEGKAGVFSDVFNGKRNVVMALTMGALKIRKGSLSKLTGNLGAVSRFVEVVGTIRS